MGVSVVRDQPPIQVASADSYHGQRHAEMQQLVQSMKSAEADSSMGVGEVEVGDLINVSCDPKADESCRSN